MNENEKYEIIKKLVDTKGNKLTASVKLGQTMVNVNRLIKGYVEKGKEFFIHGNKGSKPAHTIDTEVKKTIVDLYRTKYFDANFTQFTELLAENEEISVSETVVRVTLKSENILSPRATSATKKKMLKTLLEQQEKPGLSENEKIRIAETIIAIENAHPRRPRCAYFGEMIQMDASLHEWFGGFKSQLHIGIDDSAGAIVGAYFDKEETLNGYYNILHQILTEHGIPVKFLTDKRTVFEYKRKNTQRTEDDTFTQFGYACKQLGITIETTSVPQAKGRVERLFQTLQSRLLIELRLAGVTSIQEANEFLKSYVKKFNAKFALPIDHNKSVFEKQLPTDLNLVLAVITDRKIDAGHCIRFDKKYYMPIAKNNTPIYHRKGTDALIIKSFAGELYASISDVVYGLNEVPIKYSTSKNFDIVEAEPKEKKKYIPPMSHPWKRSSFMNFLNKQAHLKDKSA